MAQVTAYLAHDPISNTEEFVSDYDSERLQQMADAGVVFIAALSDGTREIVDPSEVHEISTVVSGSVELVTPKYVDERMACVLELIEASLAPALSLIPSKYKDDIQQRYDTLRELVGNGDD